MKKKYLRELSPEAVLKAFSGKSSIPGKTSTPASFRELSVDGVLRIRDTNLQHGHGDTHRDTVLQLTFVIKPQ